MPDLLAWTLILLALPVAAVVLLTGVIGFADWIADQLEQSEDHDG